MMSQIKASIFILLFFVCLLYRCSAVFVCRKVYHVHPNSQYRCHIFIYWKTELLHKHTFCILTAAMSGSSVGAPRIAAFRSRSSCWRISRINLALRRPCLARSWTWIRRIASSVVSLMSALAWRQWYIFFNVGLQLVHSLNSYIRSIVSYQTASSIYSII